MYNEDCKRGYRWLWNRAPNPGGARAEQKYTFSSIQFFGLVFSFSVFKVIFTTAKVFNDKKVRQFFFSNLIYVTFSEHFKMNVWLFLFLFYLFPFFFVLERFFEKKKKKEKVLFFIIIFFISFAPTNKNFRMEKRYYLNFFFF